MKNFSAIELALISLVVLSLLLPIGLFLSISSALFSAIFLIHLVLLLAASLFSCIEVAKSLSESDKILKLILLATLLLSLLTITSNILLPVASRDALIHHLAIPQLWIENNSIYQTAWHEWSYYPMLIQLGFTGMLQLGPDQLCSFYILLFLPLALLTTIRIVDLISENKNARTIGVISILLTPLVIRLSYVPLVDLPLIFLCSSGIYHLYQISRDEKASYFYAGLSWGLALSCKINALPAFVFAFLISTSILFKSSENKVAKLKYLLLSAVIAALCYSPWLLKNWAWTNNPFYPYFSSIFGTNSQKFDSGLSGLNAIQQRLMLYKETPLELALLPFRVFIQGQDDVPRLFDGRLSALLLAGLLFGLYKSRQDSFRAISFYSFTFLIFALLSTAARVRYLTPIIGCLSALSGVAIASVLSRPKLGLEIGRTVLVLQLVSSTYYLQRFFNFKESFAYFNSRITREDYLDTKIPEYPVIQFCNKYLEEDAKIGLVYTGNQFYLYKREVYSAGHTSADQIFHWLRHSSDIASLNKHVEQSGLSHLIINDIRLQSVMENSLDQTQKSLWNEFRTTRLIPIFSARGFTLYRIK